MLNDPTLKRIENELRDYRKRQTKLMLDLRNKREEERLELDRLSQKFKSEVEQIDHELSALEHTIITHEHDLDRHKDKLLSASK